MKNHLSSFLSRLALPGLMSLIMTAGPLPADTIGISVDFGNGLTGTGSFNTDGTCDPCTLFNGQVTNFTFTVGDENDDTFNDDTFTQAELVHTLPPTNFAYDRTFNTISSGNIVTNRQDFPDVLIFRSFPTFITFEDFDDAHGNGTVTGFEIISVLPEPSSLVLLAGGWLVFGLKWRFRKKSAIH